LPAIPYAAEKKPSKLSGKVYVELINDSTRLIERLVIPLSVSGLGEGDIKLNNNIANGTYTIRAYTNWMQNFGPQRFFYKQLTISKPTTGNLLVNEQHTLTPIATGHEIGMAVQLNNITNEALPYHDIELKLMEQKRTIASGNFTTSDVGRFNAKFLINSNADRKNLTLYLKDKSEQNMEIKFPLYLQGSLQNIDLQFMPEGGDMVTGLYNKVAFKAIGDDGRSIDINGVILNSKKEEMARFKSTHKGMGSFMLLPQKNEIYSAEITLNDGTTKKVPLPKVKESGIAFRLNNIANADSVYIYVSATANIIAANNRYQLIAQSNDNVDFGTSFNLTNGFYNIRLAKKIFATGIVNFTILNTQRQPLNTRKIFIDHDDRLSLSLETNKPAYTSYDSALVAITVKNASGNPVEGNFSVAVTDDASIKHNSYANNMVSHMLLTSELKGNIEEPAWYFTAPRADRTLALDNLMLTQGWTGFDWTKLKLATPKFEPDIDNSISGKLTNVFNKPISNAHVTLMSNSKTYGILVVDTISNSLGEFKFTNLPLLDTIAYTIKTHNKKGKEISAGISLNSFTPSPIANLPLVRELPWNINNTNSLMPNYVERRAKAQTKHLNADGVTGNTLKEVTIRALKKQVYVGDIFAYPLQEFTEQDLIKAGNTSLYDLLKNKLKGFSDGYYYCEDKTKQVKRNDLVNYTVNSVLITDFVIDGVSTFKLYNDNLTGEEGSYYAFLKTYLNYVPATDVKHIQLLSGISYVITITTRSGAGPFTKSAAGTMVYRQLPVYAPRQFYTPRYTATNLTIPDNRTTIHWQPNLVTDINGRATFSFYNAGKPSTYTLNIEGTDLKGSFGVQTLKIKVEDKPVN
jgi:hypothetical protein